MILIGRIVGTHGIKGYVKLEPFTDFLDRFNKNKKIKIKLNDKFFELLIEDFFIHKNLICLKLESIDTYEKAKSLQGSEIVIDEKDLKKLDKDEYYIHDLIGLKVINTKNDVIGKISDVIKLVSNDVYEIELNSGTKILYPALKEYIEEINIKDRFIRIKNYSGLIEEE